jgi:class 3 adenylate cyclase
VLITAHHEIVRRTLKRFGGQERDTASDGFFATITTPAEAVRCAVAMQREVRALGIEIRAGVHFGQVEAVDGKPGGLVVGAARIMGESGPGTVLVSSSVRDMLPRCRHLVRRRGGPPPQGSRRRDACVPGHRGR